MRPAPARFTIRVNHLIMPEDIAGIVFQPDDATLHHREPNAAAADLSRDQRLHLRCRLAVIASQEIGPANWICSEPPNEARRRPAELAFSGGEVRLVRCVSHWTPARVSGLVNSTDLAILTKPGRRIRVLTAHRYHFGPPVTVQVDNRDRRTLVTGKATGRHHPRHRPPQIIEHQRVHSGSVDAAAISGVVRGDEQVLTAIPIEISRPDLRSPNTASGR